MQPVYITNDAEIVRLEGLYIKERTPPALLSGVNLNRVGIAGEAVRGPVDKVVEITSPARFGEVFGGKSRTGAGAITSTLYKALMNKKFGTVLAVRVAGAAATVGTRTASNATPTAIVRIDANGPGSFSADVTTQVMDATDADPNHWNLAVTYQGRTTVLRNLNTLTVDDNNLVSVLGTDDANLIVLTKLANGRPLNDATPVALSAGDAGTVADSDFTASSRGLNLLRTYPGVSVVLPAERMSAALRNWAMTNAATATDRVFIVGADNETISSATARTTDIPTVRNADGRIVYTFNHVYTQDPDTNTEVLISPTGVLASILSQIDVDIDPGEEDTKVLNSYITRLYNEGFNREDYIAFREAGIMALEKDEGFAFVSSVTTSTTSGKERLTRRRSTDFLQGSIAKGTRFVPKKKNTLTRRHATVSLIESFLKDLKQNERIVEDFVVDGESLNTQMQRDQGIEKIFTRVKLINHVLALVIETEIGTTVTVKAVQ